MGRTCVPPLGAFVVLLALNANAGAHVGSIIYPIYELPGHSVPDVQDGSTSDWDDYLVPDASLDLLDFRALEVGEAATMNPDDLTTRVFLAWSADKQRIYFAVERIDNAYVNQFEGGGLQEIWRHDGVELMVDGDHSGGDYNFMVLGGCQEDEDCNRRSQLQAQQYQLLADSPDARTIYIVNERKDWAAQPPWADAGGALEGEDPFHYSLVEGYVTPWDELSLEGPASSTRSQLETGRIIGFQVSMPDFDTEPGRYHGWYTVDGQWDTWRLAEHFVDGLLVSCTGSGCTDYDLTTVRVDSWGRIKASFRQPR